MKVCALAPPNVDGVEFARRVRMMDDVGFETLWMYETPFVAESFSRAGFIAASTKHANIGVGVINPYTRHPGLTALSAVTLDRLSNGRGILLMGAGSSGWVKGLFGYNQRKPITDLLDSISVIRGMLSGEKVTHRSSGFRIINAQFDTPPVRSKIPIYVAEGENTDHVIIKASSHADGVYLGHGNRPTGWIKRSCKLIRELTGSNKMEIGAQFALRVTDDPARERDELKPWMAFYMSQPGEGERLMEFGGYDGHDLLEQIRKALKTQELISQGRNVFEAFKVGSIADAVKCVPDELVDDCSIIGSPGECRDKLGELEKAGLTFIALAFQTRFDQMMPLIKEILPEPDSKSEEY